MREIIFRGKRVDNGEWVYGVPHFTSAVSTVMVTSALPSPQHGEPYHFSATAFWVDPATVGQYTGLTANGKRIFEGDIIEGLFLHERPVAGVVAFHEGAFGVKWMRGNVDEFNAFTSCCNVKWEAIGNVADNPELLEGGVSDG